MCGSIRLTTLEKAKEGLIQVVSEVNVRNAEGLAFRTKGGDFYRPFRLWEGRVQPFLKAENCMLGGKTAWAIDGFGTVPNAVQFSEWADKGVGNPYTRWSDYGEPTEYSQQYWFKVPAGFGPMVALNRNGTLGLVTVGKEDFDGTGPNTNLTQALRKRYLGARLELAMASLEVHHRTLLLAPVA